LTEHPELEELDAVYEKVLDLYSREGIDGVLAGLPELRSVAGCRALVNLSREIRLSDPDQSAACVACAGLLASRLQPGELDERELQDFHCEMALELVFTCLRQPAAEAALARAAGCFLNGTRGEVLQAMLLDTWAVFYGCRGELEKAAQALRASLALYEAAGERHLQGRVLYRMSVLEELNGNKDRMEESLRLVSEALARLDAATEPGLYLCAIQQQATCLVDLERYREARIRLFESLGHYREHGNAGDTLQRAVLGGLSNAGLGKLDAAERDLTTALVGFWWTGFDYMFGVLALDLCAVYFDQGRAGDARAAAMKIIPVFQSLPLPAGGQKAMLYLEMALQDDFADADLLRRASRYMRELQHDPDARFRSRD
jgi:tetratricopeptide (TPR) repeat protein